MTCFNSFSHDIMSVDELVKHGENETVLERGEENVFWYEQHGMFFHLQKKIE